MSLARLVRDAAVRAVRPGQPTTSVVVNRLGDPNGLKMGAAGMLVRPADDSGGSIAYARFGRGRYGSGRYR
jgi:hypothetical protein